MTLNIKLARFITQAGVSLSVMGFCMGMLINGESTEIYLPVLTGIVGYWMPNPSAKIYDNVVTEPKPDAAMPI